MNERTRYVLCRTPFDWTDKEALISARPIEGAVRHRDVIAAAKAELKLQRRTQRYHGAGTFTDAKVLAEDGSPDRFRKLNDAELELKWSWELDHVS